MRLGEIVLNNEKQGQVGKNHALIQLKLNELVSTYPDEVTEVLQKTDVPLKGGLPAKVIYAVVVKHLSKNSTLRDAIAKMLIEMDGYHNAVGWVTIVGSALTAVSSVLGGISRVQEGQNGATEAELERQRLEMERQRAEEAAKRRRNGWLIAGGLIVSIALVLLIIRLVKGNKQAQAELATSV